MTAIVLRGKHYSDGNDDDLDNNEGSEGALMTVKMIVLFWFTIYWDTVDKKVTTRHPTTDTSNTFMSMTLGYLAVIRINKPQIDWIGLEFAKSYRFAGQHIRLKFIKAYKTMKITVGRITARHIYHGLDHFQEPVSNHIVHDYTATVSEVSL